MPIVVQEMANRRRGSGKDKERQYRITGAVDEDEARAAMLASPDAPESILGFLRQNTECGADEMGPGIWLGTAKWAILETEQPELNSFTVSIDITGQSQKITQARFHIADYTSPGKFARNFNGAIGVTSEGVEGCDVLIPQMQFTTNYRIDAALITDDYIRNTIPSIVGTTNDDDFLGYASCELLLTKVTGNKTYDKQNEIWVWDLSFGFAVSRNSGAILISGADGDFYATKLGWDYLWIYYEDRTVIGDITYTAKVPVSAHVERVYNNTDYSALVVTA